MPLLDYIKGARRGAEANELERRAMGDPFLSDALEGYDSVAGDHADTIIRLQRKFAAHRPTRLRARRAVHLRPVWAAATVLIVVAAGFMWLLYPTPTGTEPVDMIAMDISRAVDTAPAPVAEPVREQAVGQVVSEEEANRQSPPQPARLAVVEHIDIMPELSIVAPRAEEAVAAADSDAHVLAQDMPQGYVAEEVVVTALGGRKQERKMGYAATMVESAKGAKGTKAAKRAAEKQAEPVTNEEFTRYFQENRLLHTTASGNPVTGVVVVEFRVNDRGIPTGIRFVSELSPETSREVKELLSKGPRWAPTNGKRVRFEVQYQ